MFDFNDLSWDDFCKTHTLKRLAPGEHTGGRRARRPVRALATIYWYRGLIHATQAQSAYALSIKLEAHRHRTVDGRVRQHPNNWSKYAKGQLLPSPIRIELAGRIVPASASEYSHQIWSLLADLSIGIRIPIGPLIARVEFLTRFSIRPGAGRLMTVSSITRHLRRSMSRQRPLDALLIAVAGLLSASYDRCKDSVKDWQAVLHATLLIHGRHFIDRGIYGLIIDLLDQLVLRMADGTKIRCQLCLADLRDKVWRIEGIHPVTQGRMSASQFAALASKCLNRRYGSAFALSLGPPLIAVHAGDLEAKAMAVAEMQLRLQMVKAFTVAE